MSLGMYGLTANINNFFPLNLIVSLIHINRALNVKKSRWKQEP
jgi:hypothetical protein